MHPRRRQLLALAASFVCYLAACFSPALVAVRPESGQEPLTGGMCLVLGITLFFFVTPLLCWLPNPLLWTLWISILRSKTPSPTLINRLLPLSTILSFAIIGATQWIPVYGAALWAISITVGIFAAHLPNENPA